MSRQRDCYIELMYNVYNLAVAIRGFPISVFPYGTEEIGKLKQCQIKTSYHYVARFKEQNCGQFDNEGSRNKKVCQLMYILDFLLMYSHN